MCTICTIKWKETSFKQFVASKEYYNFKISRVLNLKFITCLMHSKPKESNLYYDWCRQNKIIRAKKKIKNIFFHRERERNLDFRFLQFVIVFFVFCAIKSVPNNLKGLKKQAQKIKLSRFTQHQRKSYISNELLTPWGKQIKHDNVNKPGAFLITLGENNSSENYRFSTNYVTSKNCYLLPL